METATIAIHLETGTDSGARELAFHDKLENRIQLFDRIAKHVADPAIDKIVLNSIFESRCDHIEWIMAIVERILYQSRLVPAQELSHMLLIIHEAVSNAIYHGNLRVPDPVRLQKSFREFEKELERHYPKALEQTADLHLLLTHEVGELTISDSGGGFDYRRELNRVDPPSPDMEMGRGIYLLKQTVDEIRFTDNGKTLFVRKKWRKS